MKPRKFTFKQHLPEGRYRAFDTTYIDIKLKGKICGGITERPWNANSNTPKWRIFLMIKKEGSFKNITLKKGFENKDECKKWLQERTEDILEKFDLHFIEE